MISNGGKTLAQNKKAFFDFKILEKIQAGISLLGHEVKAIKTGRVSILSAYVMVKNGQVFLVNANIPPYQPKNTPKDYNPKRDRQLLLRKKEIKSLIGRKKELGLTLIPLKVYTIRGLVKIEIGLAKGKKKFDKREAIKKREAEMKIKRAMSNR